MILALEIAFGLIALAGALSAALLKDPYAKLIALGILVSGALPFIVDRGYLDVAIVASLIAPISTIFVLMAVRRAET
ncbi:DUF2108 domain-containing protein [Methanoculleus chikugoensis]|uniref:DUF2108 domain-containing protein n=1 Tax=Methanoculleus chikugoensis TaxID=118126 RepID=A0ABM7H5R4_9EURY|nr:DUF2108 domain-containing protein [Methanoculleus chikugoensis]BBL68156.1 hypothetical protein MchiMG62_13370 [Methanoculleus chikugoensis]